MLKRRRRTVSRGGHVARQRKTPGRYSRVDAPVLCRKHVDQSNEAVMSRLKRTGLQKGGAGAIRNSAKGSAGPQPSRGILTLVAQLREIAAGSCRPHRAKPTEGDGYHSRDGDLDGDARAVEMFELASLGSKRLFCNSVGPVAQAVPRVARKLVILLR